MSEDTVPQDTPESPVAPPPAPSPVRAAQSPRRRFRLKLIGLIVVCLLLLVGIAWGSDLVWRDTHSKTTQERSKTNQSGTPTLSPQEQSLQMLNEGNSQGAQQYLDDKIKATNDPAQKASLYGLKAMVASNSDGLQDALQYSLQNYKLAPSVGSAEQVAGIEEQLGDKAAAAEYYQKALALLDKTKPNYALRAQAIQNTIDGLKQ